jgi:cytidylate kinase
LIFGWLSPGIILCLSRIIKTFAREQSVFPLWDSAEGCQAALIPVKYRSLKKNLIITIDGPAGSGKSTVAAQLAQRLGIAYLDTGAMYRAITLTALQQKVCLDDPGALERLARQCIMELHRISGRFVLYSQGREVPEAIRSPEVTNQAYKIAQATQVRQVLVEQQRHIARQMGSLVTEGRDQ